MELPLGPGPDSRSERDELKEEIPERARLGNWRKRAAWGMWLRD